MKMSKPISCGIISLETIQIGQDLVVLIYGGDSPHIGATAVAYSTPSHYRDAITTSVSMVSLPGHKDYVLAQSAAETLGAAMQTSVVVIAGVHIDNATHEQIEEVIDTVNQLVQDAVDQYRHAREA